MSISRSKGSNLVGVRKYNERLILQLIRRRNGLPKAEIARSTGLSAQTVSVIINHLISEGLLKKQTPKKGKVGQPSVPIVLNPEGAYSIGIKIGRRSLDILLMNLTGEILDKVTKEYPFPKPDVVFNTIDEAIVSIRKRLSTDQLERLLGVGIAAPYGIGGWGKELGAPKGVLREWQSIDLEIELEKRIYPKPIFSNDATAACVAELVFRKGTKFDSFLYLFIGTFIGGGIVINNHLHAGKFGNAGAIASMPVCIKNESDNKPRQLISYASMFKLEQAILDAGDEPNEVLKQVKPEKHIQNIINEWTTTASEAIAQAITSSTSIIDFDGVIIDSALPEHLIDNLLEEIKKAYQQQNLEGLIQPEIAKGSIGAGARALGGAILPLYSAFAPDRDVLLKHGDLT